MSGKRSMSQTYLLSLVVMAMLPVALLGSLWISDQRRQFEEQSNIWRQTYIETQQSVLRQRVDSIVESLEFERVAIDTRQREELRTAVDNGIAQIDSVLNHAKKITDRAAALQRAHDVLAPIRFGINGHYYINTMDGIAVLSPAFPQGEGTNVLDVVDANGVRVVQELTRRVQTSGEGFIEVWYNKPNNTGAFLALQYARYYPPLDVFVAAVSYAEDMAVAVQHAELARLKSTVTDDMLITVMTESGRVLFDSYTPNNRDEVARAFATAQPISVAVEQKKYQGQLEQVERTRLTSGAKVPVLAFVRDYPGWHWRVATGVFLDHIEARIATQRVDMQRSINQRIAFGLGLLLVLLMVALWVAHRLARQIEHALQRFTQFFADASRHSSSIDVDQLPYGEFEQLAFDANRMIEQRSRIENALRTNEQRFEMALAAANSHLWDMDLRDNILTMSGSLFAQLGYSPQTRQIDAQEWRDWIHSDDVESIQQIYRRMRYTPGTFGLEFRMRASDGSYRWFMSRGQPVEFDENGVQVRALGTVTDISDRKRIEEELVAARIAAEDANHAKSQFLSSMSHELRTPLNGVLGYAQILLRDQSVSAEQRSNLLAIESCGQHLLTLIDDVLDLAKIESGKIEIALSHCDLFDLLESVSNIVRERVEAKGLSYALEIGNDVPANIVIDEVKLRQILVNLLANAVKFTAAGSVKMRVSRRRAEEIFFEVFDTGIGIPAEKQALIFHPFQQLGDASGGTGLGLPISVRLCEAMGGALRVQSAVGVGSCFSFYLPLHQSHGDTTARPLRGGYQVLDTSDTVVTVMVVDDNPINRQVLCGMLRASNIEVIEAEHGQHALDQLRERPVSLVLMDVRMPVLDGFAATAAIKRDPKLRDIVVIAVSASAFPDVIERMQLQGCDDFISKPVRVAELLTKIAHHLRLPLRTLEMVSDTAKAPLSLALPGELITDLRVAIAVGDVDAMRAALAAFHSNKPEVTLMVRHLERLLDNFDLDAVRDWLAAAETTALAE